LVSVRLVEGPAICARVQPMNALTARLAEDLDGDGFEQSD